MKQRNRQKQHIALIILNEHADNESKIHFSIFHQTPVDCSQSWGMLFLEK